MVNSQKTRGGYNAKQKKSREFVDMDDSTVRLSKATTYRVAQRNIKDYSS